MLLLLFLHVHYYCHLAIAFVSLITTSTCLIYLIVMLSLHVYMCSTDRINKINEYDFLPSLFKVSLVQFSFTSDSCEEADSRLRGKTPQQVKPGTLVSGLTAVI